MSNDEATAEAEVDADAVSATRCSLSFFSPPPLLLCLPVARSLRLSNFIFGGFVLTGK